MAQEGAVGVGADNVCGVERVGGPVAGIVTVSAGRIGEADCQGQMLFVFDRGGEHVFFGVDVGADSHGRAIDLEVRTDFAGPHVEGLVDVGDPVGLKSGKAYCSEVEAVGVDAIPVCGIVGASGFLELHCVGFFAAASEVIVLKGFFGTEVVRVGETVPSPLCLSAEGHTLTVEFGECLEAGDVDGHGEFSVAHRERGEGVDGGDVGVVSFH